MSAFRITILFLFIACSGFAQVNSRNNSEYNSHQESWRKPLVRGGYPIKKYPKAKISGEKPVSRDIGGKANLTLEEYNRIMDRKIEEFRKRMRMEVKEDGRLQKLMRRPQYSAPSYFGHKKKPKKRARGKQKLCRECGIVH